MVEGPSTLVYASWNSTEQQDNKMGIEEKTRASGDSPREQNGPILPTVNPDAEKSQPAQPSLHPALYVR